MPKNCTCLVAFLRGGHFPHLQKSPQNGTFFVWASKSTFALPNRGAFPSVRIRLMLRAFKASTGRIYPRG